MSKGTLTDREWARKAEYEGGILQAFEYGLIPSDFADEETVFAQEIAKVYKAWIELDDEYANRLMYELIDGDEECHDS